MCDHVASYVVISVGCVVVDQQCRESDAKAKIEGHMRVSDEEAHHCVSKEFNICVSGQLIVCDSISLPAFC